MYASFPSVILRIKCDSPSHPFGRVPSLRRLVSKKRKPPWPFHKKDILAFNEFLLVIERLGKVNMLRDPFGRQGRMLLFQKYQNRSDA
jgi:hypothetical protein